MVVELSPEPWNLTIYLVGWSLGWLLFWRPRPLPASPSGATQRRRCAVVIPARDEQDALPALIGSLIAQRRDGDEIVVVDDHSSDETAGVAARCGAVVIAAPELPPGWLGKPHACSVGAAATTAPMLLFVDADVQPAPDLIDRIERSLHDHPGAVVAVQPWHVTGRFREQASVLCNVTALMGCGAFTALGRRLRPTVAFGPVLALWRSDYDRAGGHADERVRSMHTEDIGLARTVGAAHLFTGGPDTTFRMYPDGLRQTIQGWTRSIATGARFTRWWITVAVLAWVWSLAGGWVATPIVYPLSALQLWVLGRRAITIHPITALLYPFAVAVFVIIFARSTVAVVFGRSVLWKGRRVAAM